MLFLGLCVTDCYPVLLLTVISIKSSKFTVQASFIVCWHILSIIPSLATFFTLLLLAVYIIVILCTLTEWLFLPQMQCQELRKRKDLEVQILSEPVRGWEGDSMKSLGQVAFMSQVHVQSSSSEVRKKEGCVNPGATGTCQGVKKYKATCSFSSVMWLHRYLAFAEACTLLQIQKATEFSTNSPTEDLFIHFILRVEAV